VKIIYVTANLPYGSTEAFIVPEIRELTRSGHQVLVVPRSPRGPMVHGREILTQTLREPLFSARVLRAAAPRGSIEGMRLLQESGSVAIAIKNLAVVPKALWLADLAATWRADHIHCHWAGTTATMAMLASRVSGVPWSLTLHRWDIVENNLLAAKLKSASFARFISQDGLRMARALGIEHADNIRVLPMGVAIPESAPRRIPLARPVVLCPARLVKVKGHCFLLEAWRLLRSRGVDGELWLAGDGDLRTQLEKLAEKLGLRASVKFLGAIPHDEFLRIYENGGVSAVVLASIDLGHENHEGIPVALIEAMSYGIAVIATSTGGTAELLQPGSGLLVPPEDPSALADSLGSLLQNKAFAEGIADAGRWRAIETYDVVQVASKLADAFEAVPCRIFA